MFCRVIIAILLFYTASQISFASEQINGAWYPDKVQRNIRASMLVRSYFKNGLRDKETGKLRNATADEFKKMMAGENPFGPEANAELLGDIQNYMGALSVTTPVSQGGATHVYNPVTKRVEAIR